MSNQENQEKSLPLIRKIGYGVGDAGSNFCWTFIASFLMIYCTNTLGISAAVVGTLLMISKVLDGITDVFMGRVIDATHSKMGKARFWYFVSSFPVAIFTFILFNVPGSFTENTKYVFIFIIYTLIGAVFYTMNNIAYSTLTALCTKNPKDRVEMGSYRFVFAALGILFLSFATSNLLEFFGGGQKGWTAVSFIYAIICLVLLLVPVVAVRELPEEELRESMGLDKKKDEPSFLQGIVLLLKNKYFLLILVLYLVKYMGSGLTSGLGIYFATYQLGNAPLLGTLNLAGMLPAAIALPFVPMLTAKFGMSKTVMTANIIGVLTCVPVIIGGLTANFTLVLIGMVLRAVTSSPQTGALTAIIAETDENIYLKRGHRLTGMIYSCSSVGVKVGTGLGTALCGFLLDLGGFDGMAETQTAMAVTTINWSYLMAVVVPMLLSAIVFYFLNVEDENKKLRAMKE